MPDRGVAGIKAFIWLKSRAGAEVTVCPKLTQSVAIQVEGSMPLVLIGWWAFMWGLR